MSVENITIIRILFMRNEILGEIIPIGKFYSREKLQIFSMKYAFYLIQRTIWQSNLSAYKLFRHKFRIRWRVVHFQGGRER